MMLSSPPGFIVKPMKDTRFPVRPWQQEGWTQSITSWLTLVCRAEPTLGQAHSHDLSFVVP
jgi:hypothetical protein